METLCPSVQSSGEAVRDQLTLGGILRAFLPVLLHLLNLGAHKLRVLWQQAANGSLLPLQFGHLQAFTTFARCRCYFRPLRFEPWMGSRRCLLARRV